MRVCWLRVCVFVACMLRVCCVYVACMLRVCCVCYCRLRARCLMSTPNIWIVLENEEFRFLILCLFIFESLTYLRFGTRTPTPGGPYCCRSTINDKRVRGQ